MNKPPSKNLGAFIWHFLKNRKLFAFPFIFCSMASGLWSPFNNLLLKHIINVLGTATPEQVALVLFWPAALLVINFEIHNLCWRGMNYLNLKFQALIKNEVITSTFSYVHKHTHQFFQDNLSGRISNQITTLADNMERIVHDLSRHLFRSITLLVAAFLSMYYVHATFFFALLAWFVLFMIFSLNMSKNLIHLSEAHAATESMVSGKLVDSITNANNVRIFSRQDYERSFLGKALDVTKAAFQKKEKFALMMFFIQGFSLSIMLGFMLYFLIQFRAQNLVSIGDFSLIIGLSIEVGYTAWFTCEQIDELNKATGKCKQSLSAIFTPLEIEDVEKASTLSVPRGQITFSGIKFHYKGSEPLFEKKSVTIEAGQKVGLVGYSGSGKTTFVNLIMRLYDVTGGQILIDGQDIRNVTQDSLRAAIAMIPQDPSLFHRTLMENIRYGRIDASDEEVIEAAKQAHAHEFIIKLPEGYDSLVGERGIKLSGGQRQRIAIARAILKNAPILILDEATSQLDSLTESEIQESLWELMQGKTTLVIAHRLSTLLHMDRILVFDRGKIIEDGNHNALIAKRGLYKQLWDAQVGGFLLDSSDGSELKEGK